MERGEQSSLPSFRSVPPPFFLSPPFSRPCFLSSPGWRDYLRAGGEHMSGLGGGTGRQAPGIGISSGNHLTRWEAASRPCARPSGSCSSVPAGASADLANGRRCRSPGLRPQNSAREVSGGKVRPRPTGVRASQVRRLLRAGRTSNDRERARRLLGVVVRRPADGGRGLVDRSADRAGHGG